MYEELVNEIIEGRRLLNQNENAATDVKNILNDF